MYIIWLLSEMVYKVYESSRSQLTQSYNRNKERNSEHEHRNFGNIAMKREKRHGIERELSIKRIRSQKKYSILIVSVLLLTCTLIQIGFQMSEGLKAAYIENRKTVYGEWERVFVDMDESSVKVAEENPFLAQTGKIRIYGAISGGLSGKPSDEYRDDG